MSEMVECPHCGRRFTASPPTPPEPPVGTWVKGRYGAVTCRQHRGVNGEGGWGRPDCMPFASWAAMWRVRGPLVECGPWGTELRRNDDAKE